MNEGSDWTSLIGIQKDIPKFIVHYSRGAPFLSVTSVPQNKLPQIIEKLNETNAWGLNRFSDPHYLSQRTEVEAELRRFFIAKGGEPQLKQPIYFFLGRNLRFEEHKLNKSGSVLLL